MKINTILLFFLLFISCDETQITPQMNNEEINFEKEKEAILARLNNETKNAFERDYAAWTENWVHDRTISKVYINFAENSFSESIGWEEISSFVKNFIEEHPDPEPIPKRLENADVKIYGSGAWVTYEQIDSIRGRKRETRLMEKIDGQWKIAGMHTTIY